MTSRVAAVFLVAILGFCRPTPPHPPARTIFVDVTKGPSDPVPGATAVLDAGDPTGTHSGGADGSGIVMLAQVPGSWTSATLTVTADACDPYSQRVNLVNATVLSAVLTCHAPHVDPMSFSRNQLLAIRGAMWTARLNLPFGPFPGADDNSIAFDYFPFYSATDRGRMVTGYKGRGYTHAVTGPIAGTDCYHGEWPCHDQSYPAWMPGDAVPTQAQFDAYLDVVQEMWDGGLIPICFVKPDGWENHLDLLDELDALYRQPRAQRLCRVVVYPGWEPSGDKYGWANVTWVAMVQRGAGVFPDAIRLLHTPADLDAPTGQNDSAIPGWTNAEAWNRVVPFIHGWLAQYGGYAASDACDPTDAFRVNFAAVWPDLRRRFVEGYAGWPTTSADGQPLRRYAGEYASYVYFRLRCPEGPSLDLGDLAMANGASGYLDGGRVPVGPPGLRHPRPIR